MNDILKLLKVIYFYFVRIRFFFGLEVLVWSLFILLCHYFRLTDMINITVII